MNDEMYYTIVFVRVSMAFINTGTKSSLERKGIYWLPGWLVWQLVVHHPGNSGQELKWGWDLEAGANVKRNAACCHAPLGVSLIPHSAKDHLPVFTPPTMGGAFHINCYSRKWGTRLPTGQSRGDSFSIGILFPNDSSLYQADIDLASQWSHRDHDHHSVLPALENKVLLEPSYVLSLACCLSIATFAL